ncbi:hypothetical protein P872_07365 [Rhodonellum psychrophilum GCM71 = DSM 17998]|uniref:Uncharacterized protein n=2 Tax=Rhodonellum TaxID=336827 RepID=U5BWG2_9BACT|nr:MULTISPECIES: hypothetical protein [Rhodonellum]ERM82218.1 hypothetical protein P872_07365 [Rhodonellum psychrophilum GCM71 = DSM 17998]SDZ40865.1 hypothetical protein SAMN05444412_11372 [Rhodonellum ikkaensis]
MSTNVLKKYLLSLGLFFSLPLQTLLATPQREILLEGTPINQFESEGSA